MMTVQTVDQLQALTHRYVFTADGLFVSNHSFGHDCSFTVKPGDMIRCRGAEDWRAEVVAVDAATERVTFKDTKPPIGCKEYEWQTSAEDFAISLRLGELQYKAAEWG